MKKKLLTAGLAALMLAGCTGTKKIELTPDGTAFNASALDTAKAEIGRASCRERV